MGAGQEHPGQGIQLRRLLLLDAEQLVVKQPLVPVTDQALIGAGHALRSTEATDGLSPPAIAVGYGLLNDLPFAQKAPEIIVAQNAARHPIAVERKDLKVIQCQGLGGWSASAHGHGLCPWGGDMAPPNHGC